jgi:hypothetical protein
MDINVPLCKSVELSCTVGISVRLGSGCKTIADASDLSIYTCYVSLMIPTSPNCRDTTIDTNDRVVYRRKTVSPTIIASTVNVPFAAHIPACMIDGNDVTRQSCLYEGVLSEPVLLGIRHQLCLRTARTSYLLQHSISLWVKADHGATTALRIRIRLMD